MTEGPTTGILLTSYASGVSPATQSRRERSLLAAASAGRGAHLHVSTLAPEATLGLGAFHRQLEATSQIALWRRHVGGRVVPAGPGMRIVTLALPHRAALVAPDRLFLNPAQVMNRCVRGILHALRRLGYDPSYPGLDLLTLQGRAVGTLSFIETAGPTLFQAVLAAESSLAEAPFLLDRGDPEGLIPTTFLDPGGSTCLADGVSPSRRIELDPARLAARLGAGYHEAFGVEARAVETPDASISRTQDAPDFIAPPQASGAGVSVTGRLGPIQAWLTEQGDRIGAITLAGDFIAPASATRRLNRLLQGCPREEKMVAQALAPFFDADEGYILGLQPAELVELIQCCARGQT